MRVGEPSKVVNFSEDRELTQSELANTKAIFEREGFLICAFGFSDELLVQCRQTTASYIGKYRRVQDLWRRSACVKKLGMHPKVLQALHQLYGRNAFPFQTLNFTHGTQQGTHSDSIFFSADPGEFMCGVWVALEDIDMDNGPLRYFVGSHKNPLPTRQAIEQCEGENFDQKMAHYFENQSRNFERKYGIMKKGHAILWAANILHGGSVVKDIKRTRLSQVTHYYFEDCVYTAPIFDNQKGTKEFRRHPYDFGEGRFIWGRRNGRRVWPHWRSFIGGHVNNFIKRTPSS